MDGERFGPRPENDTEGESISKLGESPIMRGGIRSGEDQLPRSTVEKPLHLPFPEVCRSVIRPSCLIATLYGVRAAFLAALQ